MLPHKPNPTRPWSRSLYKRGFTLIELLVVVSILSLLFSLMLPALSKALASARAAACRSNLKQLGASFFLYTGDHDGSLPPHRWETSGSGKSFPYDNYLGMGYDGRSFSVDPDSGSFPYRNSEAFLSQQAKVYHCPADPARSALANGLLPKSYEINFYATQDFKPQGGEHRLDSLNWVPSPSSTILLVDKPDTIGGRWNGGSMGLWEWGCRYPYSEQPLDTGAQNRFMPVGEEPIHQGRFNYLFFDGSVQSLTPVETSDPPGNAGNGSEQHIQFWKGGFS